MKRVLGNALVVAGVLLLLPVLLYGVAGLVAAVPGLLLAGLGAKLAPTQQHLPSQAPEQTDFERERAAQVAVDAAVAALPMRTAGRVLNTAFYRFVSQPTSDAEAQLNRALREAAAAGTVPAIMPTPQRAA